MVLLYILWIIAGLFAIISFGNIYIKVFNYQKDTYIYKWIFLYESEAIARIAINRFSKRYFLLYSQTPDFSLEEIVTYGNREYRVKIRPEDERLPIRSVDVKTIEKFLIIKGFNEKEARQLAERIKSVYSTNVSYPSAIYWVSENMETYKNMIEWFSPYTTRVNLNYADVDILKALGISDALVKEILERRRSNTLIFDELTKRLGNLLSIVYIGERPEYYRVNVRISKHVNLSRTFILNRELEVVGIIEH